MDQAKRGETEGRARRVCASGRSSGGFSAGLRGLEEAIAELIDTMNPQRRKDREYAIYLNLLARRAMLDVDYRMEVYNHGDI
jgi:hypothetical protein